MSNFPAPETDPSVVKEAGLRRRDLFALLLLALVAATMIVVALVVGGGADVPE